MDTTDTQSHQITLKSQQYAAQIWKILYSPKTTAALFGILALVLLIWLILPQQESRATSAEIWIGRLPPAVQPWGPAFYFLGFARIFQSGWLWLPLAGLLLNSLVALAAFIPPGWQRAQNRAANIQWNHPLAQRVEHSVRLPASPDDHLAALKVALATRGFLLHPTPNDNRQISAARRRWLWLAVAGFYGGVVVLVAAFALTFFTLQTETMTLWPFKLADSDLFNSTVELYQLDPTSQTGTVIFSPRRTDRPSLALFLKPFRPAFFKQTFIWPTAIEPVLTVEARDAGGERRRLMPLQTELSPDTRLSLPLGQVDTPLYFLIPSAKLAFQIVPVDHNNYNVQVRRGSEDTPSENLMVQAGDTFDIDGLSISLTQNYTLQFMARRDFGLPLYAVAFLLMLVSGLLLLFLPPWQVWLIPEVKGRGGQLFGVVEKFGSAKPATAFLEQLMTTNDDTVLTEEEEKEEEAQ